MNLLFDFVTAGYKDGSVEYMRAVFYHVLSKIETDDKLSVQIFALYDSSVGIAYKDLCYESLQCYPFLSYVDCNNRRIDDIVRELQIDRFFIACAQKFAGRNDLELIECDVVGVIHDFFGEDHWQDKLELYMDIIAPEAEEPAKFNRLGYVRRIPGIKWLLDKFDRFAIHYIKTGGNKLYLNIQNLNEPFIRLVTRNPHVQMVTVSGASRDSFLYHYHYLHKDILVLYPPERVSMAVSEVENSDLNSLVSSRKKYYLMVSSNRRAKNPYKLLNAFERFAELNPDSFLVTLGLNYTYFPNHIPLPFLNDGELDYVMANAYALVYPSFYEGFGYPPLEAMHKGKPVLCSNTTSMPEIFGDAPIWFCPFYESSIFAALLKLSKDNYDEYVNRSLNQYTIIHARQKSDLERLTSLILGRE